MQNSLEIQITAQNLASGAFREAAHAASSFGNALTTAEGQGSSFFAKMGMGSAQLLSIKAAAGAAVGGVKSFLQPFIDGPAQFETYNTQFGVLLQNTTEYGVKTAGMTSETEKWAVAQGMAKDKMAELATYAAKTPFELPQVVQGAKVLQGFGLASSDAKTKFGFNAQEIMNIAGDTASGAGTSFEEMSGYLGKFSAGATGEAIARFQELGITTKDELGKMGIAFDKGGSMTTPVKDAFPILLSVMKKHYNGMMDKQSTTFSGMASNLSDWKNGTIRTLGEPIFEAIKPKLNDLLQVLGSDKVKGAIDGFASTLASGIGKAIDGIGHAVTILQGSWSAMSNALAPLGAMFSRVGDTLLVLADGFPRAGAGASLFEKAMGLVGDAMTVIGDLLMGNFKGALADFAGYFSDLSDAVGAVVAPIQSLVTTVVSGLAPAFAALSKGDLSGFLTGLMDGFNKAKLAILQFASDALKNALQWLVDATSKMPELVGSYVTNLFAGISSIAPKLISSMGDNLRAMLDWAEKAASDIIPLIGQFASNVLTSLTTLIATAGPKLLELASNFVSWISDQLPSIGKKVGEFAATVLNKVAELLGLVVPKLVELGGTFLNWLVSDVLPKLPGLMLDLAGAILSALGNLLKVVGPVLLDLGGKFLSWLGDVLPQLPGKLLEWTKAILGALGSLLKDIAPRLANLAAGMWHWLTVDAIPQLVANLPKFAEAIWSKITQVIQELPSHLVNLIKGMWNWLTDVLPKLGSALGDLSGKLWAWITAVLQTLPGKVGEIGKAIVTGIWDGVKALWDGFTKWIRGLLSTLADDAKKTINQIFNPSWRDAQGNPGLDPNHLPGSGSTPHFGGGGGGVPFVPPIAIPGGHGAGEGSSGGGSSSNGMQVINNFTLHSNDTRLVQTIRDEIGKTQMQVQNWQNS